MKPIKVLPLLLAFGLFFNFSFSQEKEKKLPSVGDTIYSLIKTKGVDAALAEYDKLKKKQGDKYNFDEWQLNMVGYKLLNEKKNTEAKTVLMKNIEQFPDAPNPYDSYAEACMMTGDKALAIEYYKKSLEKLNAEKIDADTKEWLGDNTKSKLAILEEKATAFKWFPGEWEIKGEFLGRDGVWNKSESKSTVTTHADGYLLVADHTGEFEKRTTLLSYNTDKGKWEMASFDNSSMTGFKVWEGKYENGECVFYSQPRKVGDKTKSYRIKWYNVKDNSASWEEAESDDGGKTWKVNSKMEFKKKTGE